MNTEPDVVDICIAVCASLLNLSDSDRCALDIKLRQEIGGEHLYARKKSLSLRAEIRTRYDGTMATTRRLAAEYGISVSTVRRIGDPRHIKGEKSAPSPTWRDTNRESAS